MPDHARANGKPGLTVCRRIFVTQSSPEYDEMLGLMRFIVFAVSFEECHAADRAHEGRQLKW